jgi:hypothetical protein
MPIWLWYGTESNFVSSNEENERMLSLKKASRTRVPDAKTELPVQLSKRADPPKHFEKGANLAKSKRSHTKLKVHKRRKVVDEQLELTRKLWSYLKRPDLKLNMKGEKLGVEKALEVVFPKDRSENLFVVERSSHAEEERDE